MHGSAFEPVTAGKRDWYPDIRGLAIEPWTAPREHESCGHDPDDRVLLAIELNALTDNSWIPGVAPLPQSPAQDDDIDARTIVGGRERAAGHRIDTERGKELGRYLGSGNPFRQISARDFKGDRAVGGHGFERLLIASQVLEVERRKRQSVDASLGESFLKRHQPIRVGVAERPNQHRIDDAKERRVRADAQAERQDDDAGERVAAAKQP